MPHSLKKEGYIFTKLNLNKTKMAFNLYGCAKNVFKIYIEKEA
jgi:hypothetical protein